MDQATVDVYEEGAARYAELRRAYGSERAEEFGRLLPVGGRRLDLGCGPGHYLPHLGAPVVAADAAVAMLEEVRRRPDLTARTPGVVCDLEALPFRRGAFAGVWASKSLQHVPAPQMPMALAGLYHIIPVGGLVDITLFAGDGANVTTSDDDDEFPGRLFTWWQPESLAHLLVGAGFDIEEFPTVAGDGSTDHPRLTVRARRARSLADTVGPGMRILMCGLNPSIYAADAGVGFARPGNRFWPAARAAGVVSVDRDPVGALRQDGVGMTDLVKRATVAASELTTEEYRAGLRRIEHLVDWLQPGVVCFVGLAGWRAAFDRRAQPGVQPNTLANVPVYVMPSTSGLNAGSSLADLTIHLRQAATLADHHT
ncbi:MAG TPA: uracil-DNA glycosylase family protein [Acidimicrobiales bacterium]|jgi:TDG/mug DNA glycosylase family protein